MYQDKSERKFEYMGDAIRIYRNRKKMYRHDLAAKAEVSLSHLQNIEHGKTNPTLPIIERICWALEINPMYIITEYFKEENKAYLQNARLIKVNNQTTTKGLAGGYGDAIILIRINIKKSVNIFENDKYYNKIKERRKRICKKATCKKHWQCCSP